MYGLHHPAGWNHAVPMNAEQMGLQAALASERNSSTDVQCQLLKSNSDTTGMVL